MPSGSAAAALETEGVGSPPASHAAAKQAGTKACDGETDENSHDNKSDFRHQAVLPVEGSPRYGAQ